MKIFRFTRFVQISQLSQRFAIRFALGFALLYANPIFAEESGVFLGVNVGYGVATMRTDFSFTEANGDTQAHKGKLANGGGVNYALIVGYKQFFTPYLGLRYYLNLNALHAIANPTALMEQHAGINTKQKFTLLNYGANVDFLGNFIANNAFSFGAFVGVGVGGDLLLGADLDNYLKSFLAKNVGANPTTDLKLRKNNVNVWLNVGLRANLAKYHSVEVFARVSALSDRLLDERFGGHGAEFSVKTTITNRYNIGIRYGFSF